jgi:predicted DNA-binding transcriptional regulator AlpA
MIQDETPIHARDCAPLVGASVSSLYRMARQNIVPCHRTGVKGRGVRFVPKEVRQALQNRAAWSPNQ